MFQPSKDLQHLKIRRNDKIVTDSAWKCKNHDDIKFEQYNWINSQFEA